MTRSNTALILAIALAGLLGLCALCLTTGLAAYLIRSAESATPLADGESADTPAFRPTETFFAPTFTPRRTPTATQVMVASPTPAPPVTEATSTPVPAATITMPFSGTDTPSPTVGPVIFDSWCVPWHTAATRARFRQIIDAVTIEVDIDEQPFLVRYIGLSPPGETSFPDFQAQAEAAHRELVEDQNLLLIQDRSETDSEGRLLRYVIASGIFVNLALVQNGYAQVAITPPDTNCAQTLREAAAGALTNQLGMWAPAPTPTRPIVFHPTATVSTSGQMMITIVQPRGTSWQDPEEFVEFRNISGHPIQMQGWRLMDIEGHTFIFPDFTIYDGNYCRIYTNAYHPEHCGLSFYSLSPIWEDRADCAYLYDRSGYLVDEYCYGW